MDIFEQFVNKIRALRTQPHHRPLKLEEKRQIALDLGLTEAEWRQLQETAAAHLTRGQGFLKHENWNEAVAELTRAADLNPDHLETLHHLTLAHRRRWLADQDQADRQKALELARWCLEIDPAHDPSLVLVGELEVKFKKQRRKIWLLAAFSVSVILISAVMALVMFIGRQPYVPPQAEAPETPGPAAVSPHPPEASTAPLPAILGLPVHFVPDDKSRGLEFSPEASDYNQYQEAYAYELRGDLLVRDIEVESLKLKIELKDESGAVLVTDLREVQADYRPVARPGDIIPCSYTYYQKSTDFPKIKEALVSVASIARRPGAGRYDPSPKIDFTWSKQPLNVDLQIRERLANVTKDYLFNPEDAHLRLVLEVENTGRMALKTLALLVKCHDQQGRIVAEDKNYVTVWTDPRLKPGQTRVIGVSVTMKNVPAADFKNYTITVLEAD